MGQDPGNTTQTTTLHRRTMQNGKMPLAKDYKNVNGVEHSWLPLHPHTHSATHTHTTPKVANQFWPKSVQQHVNNILSYPVQLWENPPHKKIEYFPALLARGNSDVTSWGWMMELGGWRMEDGCQMGTRRINHSRRHSRSTPILISFLNTR